MHSSTIKLDQHVFCIEYGKQNEIVSFTHHYTGLDLLPAYNDADISLVYDDTFEDDYSVLLYLQTKRNDKQTNFDYLCQLVQEDHDELLRSVSCGCRRGCVDCYQD